jgi:molybdopterin converting factor small subunit
LTSRMVTIEFYGLARLRAGVAELCVEAATVRAALAAVSAARPGLRVLTDSGVSPEFLISLNGVRFAPQLDEPLANGESLLILGADAGG